MFLERVRWLRVRRTAALRDDDVHYGGE